jgi:hypothetical protein
VGSRSGSYHHDIFQNYLLGDRTSNYHITSQFVSTIHDGIVKVDKKRFT